jgi:predicted SAM-dependent methyltransferase
MSTTNTASPVTSNPDIIEKEGPPKSAVDMVCAHGRIFNSCPQCTAQATVSAATCGRRFAEGRECERPRGHDGDCEATAPRVLVPAVIEHVGSPPLKLDLACGETPADGFEGVDMFAPNAKHRWNLLKFPWPVDDNSVDEAVCSHFVEHIPMAFVSRRDGALSLVPDDEDSTDLFCRFFEEVWRVLKPGAKITVVVPFARHDRAFQDPTHRRFINESSFLYLAKQWREANKLGHYLARCDFAMHIMRVVDQSLMMRHEDVQRERMAHYWNVVTDLKVEMKKLVA